MSPPSNKYLRQKPKWKKSQHTSLCPCVWLSTTVITGRDWFYFSLVYVLPRQALVLFFLTGTWHDSFSIQILLILENFQPFYLFQIISCCLKATLRRSVFKPQILSDILRFCASWFLQCLAGWYLCSVWQREIPCGTHLVTGLIWKVQAG